MQVEIPYIIVLIQKYIIGFKKKIIFNNAKNYFLSGGCRTVFITVKIIK